jgi:uncharacterized protein (DUF1697 family)
MNRNIALLRGINVGGKNIIKMNDLKVCFEEMEFVNVVTYIQSGNVLFESLEVNLDKLSLQIEKVLSERFAYNSRVVIISQKDLIQIVDKSPEGFGKFPDEYRYDIIFMIPPITAEEVFSKIKTKEGVDFVSVGNGVLYFSRLNAMSAQSQMSKMTGTAIYREMTIRNWNTTKKLCGL